MIESAIVEVTGDVTQALGVQWARGDFDAPVAGTNFNNAGPSLASIATGVATGDYSSAVGSGLTIGGFQESGGDIDFGVIIQALKSNTATNLLSTPSIMTMDNQEAEIVVGQNVPFVTGQTSSSTNTNPFTTITREDVGVTLKVIPHIHDGQAIRLEVEATAESVSNTTVAGSADLITNKRSIKTMILSDDRETIVLGGLIRDDVREVVSKVPLLGDIPLLGWLFRSKSTNQVKSNLMVFLRATIVSDAGIAKNLTQDKFNGIWEFTVSEELAADDSNIKMERLFDGLPLKK